MEAVVEFHRSRRFPSRLLFSCSTFTLAMAPGSALVNSSNSCSPRPMLELGPCGTLAGWSSSQLISLLSTMLSRLCSVHVWQLFWPTTGPHVAINRYINGNQEAHTWQ